VGLTLPPHPPPHPRPGPGLPHPCSPSCAPFRSLAPCGRLCLALGFQAAGAFFSQVSGFTSPWEDPSNPVTSLGLPTLPQLPRNLGLSPPSLAGAWRQELVQGPGQFW
jgi:hypothetical protein